MPFFDSSEMTTVAHDDVTWLWLQDAPDWTEILTHFRGSELQNYFTKILEDDMKAIIKPQYVDQIPRAIKVSVVGCSSHTVGVAVVSSVG